MGDYHDISQHPKYAFHGDLLSTLVRRDEKEAEEEESSRFGSSCCADCRHRIDPRPWYKRWLRAAKIGDYLCQVAPRVEIQNPVTGEKGYLPFGEVHSSRSERSPFHPCQLKNPTGNCRLFSLRGRF